MKRTVFLGLLMFVFLCGCERATVEKTAKPVIAPIKKTTDTVFKERKIGSDGTQAVIFPRDQEEEHKQFKLKF